MNSYTIQRAGVPPSASDRWDSDVWTPAGEISIDDFHPRSSDHRPVTRTKLLYDAHHLYVIFHVHDRYVRCVHANFQDMVCQDSCVEIFLQPREGRGYFNLEFNCGGAMLVYHVEDPTSGPDGKFAKVTPLSIELCRMVKISPTMPARIEPEIVEPVEWSLTAAIPFAIFEPHIGRVHPHTGDMWRANLFKCGDKTSHPHWASWSAVGELLRFHQPDKFGQIHFA